MPELPEVYPKPLDFTRYTETTRRQLYARVVAIQFAPKLPPEDDFEPPLYSPDEAGLMVFFAFGRWFAAWTCLEEPTYLPEHRRVEMVRLQPTADGGVMLHEV
jgi:hypothetical protein